MTLARWLVLTAFLVVGCRPAPAPQQPAEPDPVPAPEPKREQPKQPSAERVVLTERAAREVRKVMAAEPALSRPNDSQSRQLPPAPAAASRQLNQ